MSDYNKPMKVHHKDILCNRVRSFFVTKAEKDEDVTCKICLSKMSYEKGRGYTIHLEKVARRLRK